MLALTRKPGEDVYILTPEGEQIKICLRKASAHSVKLAIDAPRQYKILRDNVVKSEKVTVK